LSISDFIEYCHQRNIEIEKSFFIGKHRMVRILPNLFALIGIFLISNGGTIDMKTEDTLK
jgi:predicted HicB family RNase H-like nuclease